MFFLHKCLGGCVGVNSGKYSHQFHNPNLRNSKSISVFKEKILNFIRLSPNSFFDIQNPKGIKPFTRLRLGLSHLRKHKLKHSFQDAINPLCNCGQNIESATNFFLHFINERRTLLSTILVLKVAEDCKIFSTKSCLTVA